MKKVPLEVRPDTKHHLGVLSMGRYEDPNSGTSSFSILLGDAPHLDMQYTIFGRGEELGAGPCIAQAHALTRLCTCMYLACLVCIRTHTCLST